MIYLEGMGLLGCLTAWQLCNRGIGFKWYDAEVNINAWRACTGCCYPSGEDKDQHNYMLWQRWLDEPSMYPTEYFSTNPYWVDTLHNVGPHKLSNASLATVGGVKLVGYSMHVNAQDFVNYTRAHFCNRRLVQPMEPGKYKHKVVSHGFSQQRLDHYTWGWHALVKLNIDKEFTANGRARPCFYVRKNRFQYAYAYPQPGSDYWYAGSSMIKQKVTQAKLLAIEPKMEKWTQLFEELVGGSAEVMEVVDDAEGWRPCPAKTAGESDLVIMRHDVVYFPAMAANGFRHYPQIWTGLWPLIS